MTPELLQQRIEQPTELPKKQFEEAMVELCVEVQQYLRMCPTHEVRPIVQLMLELAAL